MRKAIFADFGVSKHWIEDCRKWWGCVLTGGDAHWCGDFDDLPIDNTCGEYEYCTCQPTPDTPEEG